MQSGREGLKKIGTIVHCVPILLTGSVWFQIDCSQLPESLPVFPALCLLNSILTELHLLQSAQLAPSRS